MGEPVEEMDEPFTYHYKVTIDNQQKNMSISVAYSEAMTYTDSDGDGEYEVVSASDGALIPGAAVPTATLTSPSGQVYSMTKLGGVEFYSNEGRNLQIWHQLLWRSALVVVVLSIVDFSEIASWLNPIYNLMILMMIVSAIVSAWYASEGVRKVLHHLCIFGRMSLTNYLLQSIIGCAIFCGYGLACYRHLGVTYAVMVGCGMVVCQYLFARYWFSNHPRGPLEGLWRKLTWMRL